MIGSQDNLNAQLRKGVLQYCVLQSLKQGASYGLEIAKTLTDAGMISNEGTIYPLLSRLRSSGLVLTEWVESDEGPPRRYYRLSAKGETALADFRSAWKEFQANVNAVLGE